MNKIAPLLAVGLFVCGAVNAGALGEGVGNASALTDISASAYLAGAFDGTPASVLDNRPPGAQPRISNSSAIAAGRKCSESEDTLKAFKLTKIDGAIRVDYQFIANGEASWANMNPALLRKFRVKVGAIFCMTHDKESAETAGIDYD